MPASILLLFPKKSLVFKHIELHFNFYPDMDKRIKTEPGSFYLLNKCEGNVDVAVFP